MIYPRFVADPPQMNILYLAHRIPYPPNKGDKIRSYHQLMSLAKRHTIHLACFIDDPEDVRFAEVLCDHCASVDAVFRSGLGSLLSTTRSIWSRKPLSVEAFYSNKLRQVIERRLADDAIDCIFVFSSSMAQYVEHVRHIPRVMDFVDMDSEKWKLYAKFHMPPLSWIYHMEGARLHRYETAVGCSFDHSVVISDLEADVLRREIVSRPITVIPNGVDLEYFRSRREGTAKSMAPVIVFSGAMDYFPNIDAVNYFCGEILPRVRRRVPEARFHIVGRNPGGRIRRLGMLDGVLVTGTVDDVRPYLEQAQVAVAPLRIARGIQNKILEAMAMEVPVVGTSCAFEGTYATKADGILVADAPQDFAEGVVEFMRNPPRRQESAKLGRRYVERHHNWDIHLAKLGTILEDLKRAS